MTLTVARVWCAGSTGAGTPTTASLDPTHATSHGLTGLIGQTALSGMPHQCLYRDSLGT